MPFRPLSMPVGLAVVVLAMLPAAQALSSEPVIAPHRAVYDLVLDSRRTARGIDGARGRIAFETSGNLCEGFTTTFRQVVEISAGGTPVVMDVRTAHFEEGDGSGFRFTSQTTQNGAPREETDGSATRMPDALRIAVRRPRPVERQIDGQAIFPTEHLRRIVAAARAGQSILEVKVYDGAESGEKLYNATAVIGRRIAPDSGQVEAAARNTVLASLARWPVTISYFEVGKDSPTPAYAISFELYENGVSRALVVDYGEFALRGTLAAFEPLAASECRR
jgi:hypothetical protein